MGMDVKKVAVIGSGVMGKGIAYVFLVNGFQVYVTDQKEEVLKKAKTEIERLMDEGFHRGKITEAEWIQGKSNITYSLSIEETAQDADLIIEAVPEKIEIKKAVFETIDRYSPIHCILATNTSTMSPTEIASFTNRPDKVIGMHFFNPVHKMKFIEIVKGLETSDETVQIVQHISQKIKKEYVVVNDFPGFVTSRISALVGNEAFYMLQEGVATPEEIDKAIKLGLNFPMGPFELADLVGLDTRLNNLNYLHKTLGEKYRPAPLLVQYVHSGRLGRKTGRGVYDYADENKN